jgi:hypothetical protein
MNNTITRYAVILASVFASVSANAGTSAKGSAPVQPVVEDAAGISAVASFGYDSRYYFRGLWFSNDNGWGNLAVSIPVGEKTTVDAFAYYTDSFSSLAYTELDLGASISHDVGFAKLTLSYTMYEFFDGFFGDNVGIDHSQDVGLSAAIPLGPVTLTAGYWYDLTIEAGYAEVGLSNTLKLTESLSLSSSAGVGYGFGGYYTFGTAGSALNHAGLKLALPYQATSSIVIEPYVAANFSLKGREMLNTIEGKNEVFGGLAVKISF